MTDRNEARPATAKDFALLEEVFDDAVPYTPSRRKLLGQAAVVLGAAGGTALLGVGASSAAAAAPAAGLKSVAAPDSIWAVLASVEAFGVTFLTEAIKRSPGTPSAQFAPILRAAVTAEYNHYLALQKIGAQPLSLKIWIPDMAFGAGGIGLFQSIEKEEDIEISAYLVGVTSYVQSGDAAGARLCAEALGVEAEHRVLARSAQGMLAHMPQVPPNNRGFESYPYRTADTALAAHESLGIRYGTQGPTPGAFYEFPGDPLQNGAGIAITATVPDSPDPYSAATGPATPMMPIPVGAPDTGGGSTAGFQHRDLVIGGGALLAGAAVATGIAAAKARTSSTVAAGSTVGGDGQA